MSDEGRKKGVHGSAHPDGEMARARHARNKRGQRSERGKANIGTGRKRNVSVSARRTWMRLSVSEARMNGRMEMRPRPQPGRVRAGETDHGEARTGVDKRRPATYKRRIQIFCARPRPPALQRACVCALSVGPRALPSTHRPGAAAAAAAAPPYARCRCIHPCGWAALDEAWAGPSPWARPRRLARESVRA